MPIANVAEAGLEVAAKGGKNTVTPYQYCSEVASRKPTRLSASRSALGSQLAELGVVLYLNWTNETALRFTLPLWKTSTVRDKKQLGTEYVRVVTSNLQLTESHSGVEGMSRTTRTIPLLESPNCSVTFTDSV